MEKPQSFARKNVSLAWPLAFNAILMQAMLMIDTLLVAPLGEISLASMGVASALIAFVMGVQFSIANGTQLLVGRASGSGNQQEQSTAFWTGLFINLVGAVFFFSVISVFGYELVTLVADDLLLIEQAYAYLAIMKYLIIMTAFTQLISVFFNGCGKTKVPFQGYLIELPLNAVISFFLIHGWGEFTGLGVIGAAYGSLVAICVRLIYLLVSLKRQPTLSLKYPKSIDFFAEVHAHLKEIGPIATTMIILSIGATFYQLLFAQLSLYAYAAIMLVFPWVRIGTQFITAWAQASAISISQAIGQKRTKDLRQFVSESMHIALGISLVLAVLFYLLSETLHLIYPSIENETRVALGSIALLYIVLPIPRTYNTIAGHVLRSIGDSVYVLKLSFIIQWLITIPLTAVLIIYFEVSVFWAFAMMPIEEALKTGFLYKRLNYALKAYD